MCGWMEGVEGCFMVIGHRIASLYCYKLALCEDAQEERTEWKRYIGRGTPGLAGLIIVVLTASALSSHPRLFICPHLRPKLVDQTKLLHPEGCVQLTFNFTPQASQPFLILHTDAIFFSRPLDALLCLDRENGLGRPLLFPILITSSLHGHFCARRLPVQCFIYWIFTCRHIRVTPHCASISYHRFNFFFSIYYTPHAPFFLFSFSSSLLSSIISRHRVSISTFVVLSLPSSSWVLCVARMDPVEGVRCERGRRVCG